MRLSTHPSDIVAITAQMVRSRAIAFVASVLLALGLTTAATSAPSQPVAVSGTLVSPLADCTADAVATQPGRNFPNTEVEPYVAANPTNAKNIVAVWQQDRWSNGGSRGNVVGASFDGGATWRVVTATKSSLCTGGTAANGGDLARATDPWLSFAPNGDLYLASLMVKQEVLQNSGAFAGTFATVDNAVLVAKSIDGGATWSDPVTLIRGGCRDLNDKEAVTADPNEARFAYTVWTRYSYPTAPANASCLGVLNAEISVANVDAASFVAPGWFSRTTDGGRSWEPARVMFPVGQGVQSIGHQVVVLPGVGPFAGQLVDFFILNHLRANAHGERGLDLALIRSRDKGVTWSSQLIVDRIHPVDARDPLTGAPIRAGVSFNAAVHPQSGVLYAVWTDGRFSGGIYSDVVLSMSVDGGATWTPPVKVNLTPATPQLGNRQAFLPSVAVGADGSIAVSYYDLRFNGTDTSTDQPLETDHFLVRCRRPALAQSNGCSGEWIETRITPVSFNLRAAPNAGGLFLGDYMGLAPLDSGFGALFTQSMTPLDRASVFFAPVP